MQPAQGPVSYTAGADSVTLVLMRNTRFGGAVEFYVVDAEGRFIGGTTKSMHGVVSLPAGEYMLYVVGENSDPVHAVFAAGRTYVMQTQVRIGVWKARVTAAPIRRNMAEFAEIGDWIRGTRAWVPIPAEGAQWAQSNADNVRERIQSANEAWAEQTPEWQAQHSFAAEDGLTAEEVRGLGLQ